MRSIVSFASGNFSEIRAMAERHNFSTEPVAMKNTHHAEMSELLVVRKFLQE
jgi:DNA adenine methylase